MFSQSKQYEGFEFLEDIELGKRYIKAKKVTDIDENTIRETSFLRDVEIIEDAEITTDLITRNIISKSTGEIIDTKFKTRQVGIKITVTIDNELVCVDTWTGKGYDKVLRKLDKLIGYLASQFYNVDICGDERCDVKQQLSFFALESIKRFNPEKNASMVTFVKDHITNQKNSLIKKSYSEKRAPCMYSVILQKVYKCPKCNSEVILDCEDEKNEKIMCDACSTEFDLPKAPIKKKGPYLNKKELSLDATIQRFEEDGMRTIGETIIGDDGSWVDEIGHRWDIQRLIKKYEQENKLPEALVLELTYNDVDKGEIVSRLGKMKYNKEARYSFTGLENVYRRLSEDELVREVFSQHKE